MAYKLDYYSALAEKMIENDRLRDKAFFYYQKMRRMEWSIPDNARNIAGIRKSVDTSPSDAISKANQVMASRPPRLHMMPVANSPEDKQRANMIERVLKWHLTNADRRRSVGVVTDIFESAALYGAVALNVMDLENEIKNASSEAVLKKLQRARRKGRFIVNTFMPADVHVRRSALDVECVLLCQEKPAHEVVAEYPQAEKLLRDLVEQGKNVSYRHYIDYDNTCVWVQADGIDAKPIMPPQNHNLPFMYWVALMGGTTLDSREEHKYRPILYPVYMSDEWETKNMVDTLVVSGPIWNTLPPIIAVEGLASDEVQYNTGDPYRRVMTLPPGSTLQQLPPNQIDPGLFTLSQEFAARMRDSTVSTLLGGADIPAGTSFAALNLATQTALGALKPAKELTEKALAETFTLMLLWSAYTEVDLTAYNANRRSAEYAEEYTIPWDTIDEENIYITVELDPDEPTDKMQRANTASLLMNLRYPKKYALEDMGVEDPENAVEEWTDEQLYELEVEKYKQASMMEIQQMAQQAQMAQQQEAQALAQQAATAPAIPGGQGFNPAMGGMPPAAAFPEATRESGLGQMGMGEMV